MQFCVAQFALGILDILLELHVADTCDDGVDLSPYFYCIFKAPGCQSMLRLVDIKLPRDGRV